MCIRDSTVTSYSRTAPLDLCPDIFSWKKLKKESRYRNCRGWSLYISHCSHKGKNASLHGLQISLLLPSYQVMVLGQNYKKRQSYHGQNIPATDTWYLIYSPTLSRKLSKLSNDRWRRRNKLRMSWAMSRAIDWWQRRNELRRRFWRATKQNFSARRSNIGHCALR